jgi:hypothetical protein
MEEWMDTYMVCETLDHKGEIGKICMGGII